MRAFALLFPRISFLLSLLFFVSVSYSQSPPGDHEPGISTVHEAAGILSEYVSVSSESGSEQPAGKYLSGLCRDKGLFVRMLDSDEAGCNFIASLYPLEDDKPNIIFLNHIDVVPAGDPAEWIYPPYSGAIEENKIWGRGSIDNKGLAVIQLMALSSFIQEARDSELPYNVSLLSVSGEETGGERGSGIISSNHMEEINAAVIIGEGSCGFEDMDFIGIESPVFGISIADKSMLWLELHVHTEERGHASVNMGKYPNKRLVEGLHRILDKKQKIRFNDASLTMFRELGKVRGGLKGFSIRHIHWLPFRPVLKKFVKQEPRLAALACNNVTLTHFRNPEGSINQHSGEARAYLDCRLLPGFTAEEMVDEISKTLNDTSIHIEVITKGPPALMTEPDVFFEALSGSIKTVFKDAEVVPVLFPATTDNNYFREQGCPVYGLNPFFMSLKQISTIHSANEYMDVEDVLQGIEVFKVFIGKMLGVTPSG
jgi:carboxypeptidase PM20D1